MIIEKTNNTFTARNPALAIAKQKKLLSEIKSERENIYSIFLTAVGTATCGTILCNKSGNNTFDNIKDIRPDKEHINITTTDGKFFRLDTHYSLLNDLANNLIQKELDGTTNFFGIPAYLDCISRFDRDDILKKGLEFNNNDLMIAGKVDKQVAADFLSKKLKQNVTSKDLFCIDTDFYYADYQNDTIYKVRQSKSILSDKDVTSCKFIRDTENNIIGYIQNKYDLFHSRVQTKQYVEQQTPSYRLPDEVDQRINMDVAQAFRFGNYNYNENHKNIADAIIDKLKTYGLSDASLKNLKAVKVQGENRPKVFFTYYNKDNGRSILFNRDGNYINQITYIRNDDGEIIDYYMLHDKL